MISEIFASETATTILLAIFIAVVGIFLFRNRHGRKFPPGPVGLPFVGYLPFMTKNPHIKFQELRKKYGPIYSLSFGSDRLVILCDYPSMKEAFSQDALIGRPPNTTFNLNKETTDLGAFNHLAWKDQRRFSLHLLRDLGFGKSKMENHIAEEIKELLERLEKEHGNPIVPSTFLAPSMSNNISSLMFGKRRKFDDPKRVLLDGILRDVAKFARTVGVLTFFPVLQALVRFLHIGHEADLSMAFERMKNHIREEYKEHESSFDPNDIRDFMDGYMVEIEKTKSDPKSTFKVPVMEDVVRLFFGAGSETVRNALDWLVLTSAAFPDVQKKVQVEIDEVIGKERFPSRSDHHKMPYTDAVILEILRWRASLPINLPRYTIDDTEVFSYFIPKNTQVVAVFWAVNHDPELWGEDVEEFKPERFLSEDGKEIRKPEFFIPFSVGKRSCPGESLAYVEIFMYFTALLQKFHLRLPEGAKPDLEGSLGIGLQAKAYKLCFEPRS